jgi:hypothetical protein
MECASRSAVSQSSYEYTGLLGWNAKAWTTTEKEETGCRIPLSGYAGLCFMDGMQKGRARGQKKLG